mgnify:CR=1 FL=1
MALAAPFALVIACCAAAPAARSAPWNLYDLGALDGGTSAATAINDAGVIVGGSSTDPGSHAFVWDGEMTDLGTLGGSYSMAWDINAAGQIVGCSTTADGTTLPFLSLLARHDAATADARRIHGLCQGNQHIGTDRRLVGAAGRHGDSRFRVGSGRQHAARPWHPGRHEQLGP